MASPDIRNVTLVGSIVFLLIMVLGGAATLWGPIVGAFAVRYPRQQDPRRRREREGIIGTVFRLAQHQGSPATLILAIVISSSMFVAPFGIVGLLKRIVRRFVVDRAPPGRHADRREPASPRGTDESRPPPTSPIVADEVRGRRELCAPTHPPTPGGTP